MRKNCYRLFTTIESDLEPVASGPLAPETFGFDAQTKVVDLYVHYLRRKLGDAGSIIQTVRGVGYAVGR